ncbi:head decoration [Escherichia phage 4MG]|uniref:Putative head stabilization/decoration protein n=1 Tax=Escherichia phage 4MG TaxID=1391428 RepID=V5KSC8_9CAUD|nr:head decoration [Escherichia phage 4MG]AGZ17544.1 putative head stabilization/decoration protein [Escherichia phage 4MG]
MANPIQGYYSDIVLGKVDSSDQGYSFLEMEITYAAGLKAGMIVKADGTLAATADAASAFGVITDRDLVPAYSAPRPFVVGQKYNFVVAVRGLTLNKSKLFFADGTTAINAAAIAALEAKGLKITDKYYDGSVEIPVTSI